MTLVKMEDWDLAVSSCALRAIGVPSPAELDLGVRLVATLPGITFGTGLA